jgi:hypothetical protein
MKCKLFKMIEGLFLFLIVTLFTGDILAFSGANQFLDTLSGANVYYISMDGNDNNDGLSPFSAWKTIAQVNSVDLLPGDSILFETGGIYKGRLEIYAEGGNESGLITISSYGDGALPVLDGDGYREAIHIQNSGYIHLSGLEITNENSISQPGTPTNLRYGLYIQNTYSDGTTFDHFRFDNLVFTDIYPTDQISDNDQTGINAHAIITSGSWGDDIHPIRFRDILLENCYFTRTGRHATLFKASQDLVLRYNLYEHVGGAGMVFGKGCSDVLVEYNTTNYTGSSIDGRMAGRGSGLWCFQTKNVVVQHNRFMFARGVKDSFGMHMDIGNRNLVYQYNFSIGNEGGFVEILGGNVNVGYRYNVSIADGWRKRENTNQKGRIFWIGQWSGNVSNPIGSDSVFIYNNSVFVPDTIVPHLFFIEPLTMNTKIVNNIVYVSDTVRDLHIKNNPAYNDIDYNIWYGNIPLKDTDGDNYRGTNDLGFDPLYSQNPVTDSSGFILQEGSFALGTGKLIFDEEVDMEYDYYFNHGGIDYYGNEISVAEFPNRGADNGTSNGTSAIENDLYSERLTVYPNPVRAGESVYLDIPEEFESNQVDCRLIKMDGAQIRIDFSKSSRKVFFNTNRLKPGSYILEMRLDNKVRAQIILII